MAPLQLVRSLHVVEDITVNEPLYRTNVGNEVAANFSYKYIDSKYR